jgi:hypothetical protein
MIHYKNFLPSHVYIMVNVNKLGIIQNYLQM